MPEITNVLLQETKIVKLQGNLNTDPVENYITTQINDIKTNLILNDETVTFEHNIVDVKKKVLIYLNKCKGQGISQDLVFESSAAAITDSTWVYYDYVDGWYSTYLFYCETWTAAIPTERMINGIIYYTDEFVSGFFVDVTGTGSDLPSTPGTTEWKEVEGDEDWINYAKALEGRTSDFLGEFGLQQVMLITNILEEVGELSIKEACAIMADICGCEPTVTYKLYTLLIGAQSAFCKQYFYQSERILEFALNFLDTCETFNCTSC